MFTLTMVIVVVMSLIAVTRIVARSLGIRYTPHPGQSQNQPITTTRKSNADTTKWRSVKIKPGLICCKGAESMKAKVYFAADAPTLPIASCTEKQCQCKYAHLDDRRDGHDRREATEYSATLFNLHEKERRDGTDRRIITF